MKLALFPFFLCLLIFPSLYAQITLHGAITSNGTSLNASGVKLNYAIGQLINRSYSSSGIRLNEGILQQNNSNLINSILENATSSNYLIFPNPAEDLLTIKSSIPDLIFKIYNLNGQIEREGNLENYISTEDLLRGIYFLKLVNKKSEVVFSSKFIKT